MSLLPLCHRAALTGAALSEDRQLHVGLRSPFLLLQLPAWMLSGSTVALKSHSQSYSH